MAGQSDSHLSFSAEEVEFMAEDELTETVPNMRMDALNLGILNLMLPIAIATQVPLWLAVVLKKRGKCTISGPASVRVCAKKLTEALEAVREAPSFFQPLPFHYVEILRLLFDQSLLEDIQNVTFYKKGINLEDIQGFAHAMKVFCKHDNPEMIYQVEPPTIQRPPTTDNIPRRVVRRVDLRGIRWPLDS